MPRDYAKTKKSRKKASASRAKGKKPVSKTFVFFTLMMACGLAALLFYLTFYAEDVKQPLSDPRSSSKSTQKHPEVSRKKAIKPRNQEKLRTKDSVPFYTTHQEMMNKTVEIPIEDLKLAQDLHPYVYLMPCGSFRDKQRAEQLKAQIALVGYESKINHVVVKSEDWYRVELGPYKSKRKTESIRHRLQDNGLNFCKIWPQRKRARGK